MKKVLVVFFILFSVVAGQSQGIYNAKRISGDVNFDGIPDESLWGELIVPMVQSQPVFKGPDFKGKAIVAFGYDDTYIWVSGKMEYDEGMPMRAVSNKRDHMDPSNDYFAFIIDSYNDNENALGFQTTPAGVRVDYSVFNDGQADFPFNTSWNTFWDVKTQVIGNTWNIEMRIPISSLKFQDDNGKVVMGITVWWYAAAINQIMSFPELDPRIGSWTITKPSISQDVEFEGIYSNNPIYVAPFVATGFQSTYPQDDITLEYNRETDNQLQAGLDAKITIGDGWTLDLTANTDFAQAEADDQQVNLTRFSLFFPEKRQFFQERSSIFEVNSGYINRLFYSRTIGLDENFNIVPILGGARVIGRAGKWDVAALDMQGRKTDGQLSTNYGVLRLRKQISESNSYLGGVVTNKIDAAGNYDLTTGLDGIFNISGSHYLNLVAATVLDTSDNISFSENTKFLLFAENRSQAGFIYALTLQRTGANFIPAMGFERRPGTFKFRGTGGYGWYSPENSKILRNEISATTTTFTNIASGINESEEYQMKAAVELKRGLMASLEYTQAIENITESFSIYDVTIDPSLYNFGSLAIQLGTPASKKISANTNLSFGQFYDGNSVSLAVGPQFKPNALINFQTTYNLIHLNFPSQSLVSNIHFASLKTEYTPTTKISISLLSQYNSYSKRVNSNFRIRYNPKEGNDLYIVLNSLENTQRSRYLPLEPMLPNYDSRAIIVKYIYTFIL